MGRGVELLSRLIIDGVDDDVGMDMISVNVSCHQTLITEKLSRCPSKGDCVSLFWCDTLTGGKTLNVMVVLSALGLVPDVFRVLHFQHSRHGVTVNA